MIADGSISDSTISCQYEGSVSLVLFTPISQDTVNALDKTWHPACFVCQECGSPISSGAFHVEDGMPYCMKGKLD